VRAKIQIDMRRLVAERLRAEAGASMSAGAAAGERIRQLVYETQRKARLTKQVSEAVVPLQSNVQDDLIVIFANATRAQKVANDAVSVVARAEHAAQMALRGTRQLTAEQIESIASPDVKAAVAAHAIEMELDKPSNYGRLLSVRAADPYMRAMSVATQRVSEYTNFADKLQDQARSSQWKATELSSHASALAAQGDKIGSQVELKRMRSLLGKSRQLEEEARRYWAIADETQKTIPEWQDAATNAAAYSASLYDASRRNIAEPASG